MPAGLFDKRLNRFLSYVLLIGVGLIILMRLQLWRPHRSADRAMYKRLADQDIAQSAAVE